LSAITVFACESQPIVVEGLEKVLNGSSEFDFVGSVANLSEALDAARKVGPDIILVDHSAGLKTVFQFISDIRNTSPACRPVLWVNEMAEIDCFRALQMGVRGVLKKTQPVESVVDCLRAVGQGDVWMEGNAEAAGIGSERRGAPRLTPRERDIVRHVCAGLKNKEIAAALSITAGTVKVHLMHIFEKTGVKDRFELAIHGRKLVGLEPVGEPA
jgi:DNA-binding NarL/FixJ family response regulator